MQLYDWTNPFVIQMFSIPYAAVFTLALSSQVSAWTYGITANYVGQSLLDAFTYDAIADPTHGRGYVSLVHPLNPTWAHSGLIPA